MKAMMSASFFYEREQAVFRCEENSCNEVCPYQDKQQPAGSGR